MVPVIGAKAHLREPGRIISQMANGNERVYVNCERCSLNFGVTPRYYERMNAQHIPFLCNECRNRTEQGAAAGVVSQ